MKQWLKRLGYKAVAAVVVAAVGLVLFGVGKFLGWIFSLIPKTSQNLDPYSVVITVLVCAVISLLGEVVSWIWKKNRRNKFPRISRRKRKNDDDDEEEED